MRNKFLPKVWTFIKNFFTKNIGLKIIALLMAVLVWAYVLNDENPYRVKNVTVNLSFDGEAELLAKGLCVRGERAEILETVSVAVKTQIANYSSLSAGQINATVSLRNISEARTYELPVSATVSSGFGVVQGITPGTVTVEIDSLVEKTIPVTPIFEGTVPEGYWADMDASSVTSRIDIEGPKTDISNIRRAECYIDLSGCTSLLYSTYDVILYGADDEVVDSSIIVGTIPSATVRVPIYAEKYVSIDVDDALTGVDALSEINYEIQSVTVSPETVRIVGESSVLESIDSLTVTPVDVSAQTAFKTYSTTLVLPEGVRLPDENVDVSLSVDVEETVEESTFGPIAVTTEGLTEGLNATVDAQSVSVKIQAPVSILNMLTKRSITVSADLSTLTAGEHDVPLEVTFANQELSGSVTCTVLDGDGKEITTVHVVIDSKIAP